MCTNATYIQQSCSRQQDTVCAPCLTENACTAGTYLTGSCLGNSTVGPSCSRCSALCAQCAGPRASDCTECYNGFIFNPAAGTCGTNCSAGQYIGSGGVCQPCNAACGTACYGPSNSSCLSCPAKQLLYQTTCVGSCPASTYIDATGTVCDVCTQCSTSQFITQACTLQSVCAVWLCFGCMLHFFLQNTVCQALTACAQGQYQSVSPTATSDRTCSACSICSAGTVGNIGTCTVTQNTVCTACDGSTGYQNAAGQIACLPVTVCQPGTTEAQAPSPIQNRFCIGCAVGTYKPASGSQPCQTVTKCNAGYIEVITPTMTSDRVCGPCQLGDTFNPVSGATSCEPTMVCQPGYFQSKTATLSTDRTCSLCGFNQWTDMNGSLACNAAQSCPPSTYVLAATTVTTDRQCANCSIGQFSSALNQASCSAFTNCGPGEYVFLPGTPVRDRTCGNCDGSTVYQPQSNQNQCINVTVCETYQYQTKAPTVSSDRGCMLVSNCSTNSYEIAAPTLTSDRVCHALTPCPVGWTQEIAPTATSDRRCGLLQSVSMNVDYALVTSNATEQQAFLSTFIDALSNQSVTVNASDIFLSAGSVIASVYLQDVVSFENLKQALIDGFAFTFQGQSVTAASTKPAPSKDSKGSFCNICRGVSEYRQFFHHAGSGKIIIIVVVVVGGSLLLIALALVILKHRR